MNEPGQVLLLTTMAGAAIPLGGLLAKVEHIHPNWLENEFRHFVIAFGGGVLFSAVSFLLVPHGVTRLSVPVVTLAICAGATVFMGLDILFDKLQSPASQLAAMLTDFIPEALALGSMFASGNSQVAMLLAMMITLQNVPEAFNSYRELMGSKQLSSKGILVGFAGLSLLGPISGMTGYLLLSEFQEVVAFIMLFAAGGILYSVFQDIAPQAKLDRHRAPPLGAVAGFLLGLVGDLMTK